MHGIFVIVTTHPWPLLRLSVITEIYTHPGLKLQHRVYISY